MLSATQNQLARNDETLDNNLQRAENDTKSSGFGNTDNDVPVNASYRLTTEFLQGLNNASQFVLDGLILNNGSNNLTKSKITAEANIRRTEESVRDSVKTVREDPLKAGGVLLTSAIDGFEKFRNNIGNAALGDAKAQADSLVSGAKIASVVIPASRLGFTGNAANTAKNIVDEIGVTFEGTLYRSVGTDRDPLQIHPLFNTIEGDHRYSRKGQGGLYLASSQRIVNKEFTGNGGSLDGLDNFSFNVKIDKLLDLTDPSVREKMGVSLKDLTRRGDVEDWKYEITGKIGKSAKFDGYNGIIAPSAQADGGVNVILFKEGLIK